MQVNVNYICFGTINQEYPTQNYDFWLLYFCLYFRCGYDEKLECEPQPCEPQPMMQKMLAIRRWKWKIYLLLDKPFQIQRYHDAKFLSNLLKRLLNYEKPYFLFQKHYPWEQLLYVLCMVENLPFLLIRPTCHFYTFLQNWTLFLKCYTIKHVIR